MKLKLSTVLDVVGTLGVISSMLIVAFNVNRNTFVQQTTNENFLYELHGEMFRDEAIEPELAHALWKHRTGQALTGTEEFQVKSHIRREINLWEIAYYRNTDGLLPEDAWTDWDSAFSGSVVENFPRDWWNAIRFAYGESFADHVDERYAAAAGAGQ